MAMRALREGASGGFLKYILMGILVLACGGLVMMDIGGFFRGGVTSNDVAKVGNQTISIVSFDRKMRQSLNRLGIPPQEAYKLGYVNQFLGSEIRSRIIEQDAAEKGLLVGQQQVAGQIKTLIDPLVQQGRQPQDVLNQILLTQGMSEAEFVRVLGNDMASNLLTAAIQSSFSAVSEDMAKDLYIYQNEKRDIEIIPFYNSDLKDIPEPTDEQLFLLYEAVKEEHAQEERRVIQIIAIDTSDLRKTLEISDEELRSIYESNIDQYEIEKTWTLEQTLLDRQEQAEKIAAQAKSKSLEKAVINVTGKNTGYLGEKKYTETELPEDLRGPLQQAAQGNVIGPVKTPLGWQVLTVKNMQEAGVLAFENIKDELKEEEEEIRLIDEQYNLANQVDDMLAGGASVEEVEETVPVNITTLPPVNRYGQNEKGQNALAEDYPEIAPAILETAYEFNENETSPVMEMADGSFMAIHVQSIFPKTYTPLEDIRDELVKRWKTDQRKLENKLQVSALAETLKSGTIAFSELAKSQGKTVVKIKDLKRGDQPKKPLTLRSSYNLFEASLNEPVVIEIEGGAGIARVTDFSLPADVENNDAFSELQAELERSMQEEALLIYLEDKNREYKPRVNQALLERMYAGDNQAY